MLNFRDYIQFAEKQILLAEEQKSKSLDETWAVLPATILAWSAIESFVNNRLDDFVTLPGNILQFHEKAFLSERKIVLAGSGSKLGEFVLEGTEYNRLENKIFFLIAKFGKHKGIKVDKGGTLWQRFEELKNARDALVHPRQGKQTLLSIDRAKEYIETSKEIIRLVSINVWNKEVKF